MVVAAFLSLAAGTPNVLFATPNGAPDSTRAADSTRAPAFVAPAFVAVETRPSGLRVTLGAFEAGWSPLAPTPVPAGKVKVRAYPTDARRFNPVIDGATLDVAPGETLRVFLDLRPHPLLESKPTAALSLVSRRDAAPDSALGTTPIRLAPSLLESRLLRLEATGYADSLVNGSWLLDVTHGGEGAARIALRSLHLPPPAPPPGPSLLGQKWFQLGLVGVGALLTGGAAILRHQGDLAYDRYLEASDPRMIEHEYDRTVRYDRISAATLGTGQVMFTAGLFLLVTGLGR